MGRITGGGCDVCRGAIPNGTELAGHTGLCAQYLADLLAAERARAERAEARLAKLEAVAEAAREFRRWDAILALTLGEGEDAEDAQDDLRAIDTALAALDGGGK